MGISLSGAASLTETEIRREYSARKIREVRSELERLQKPPVDDNACVYLTGSYGRGEATDHSDLDLFILARVESGDKRRLSRLDEICLEANLIRSVRSTKIPDFSGDGEWMLRSYTAADFVKHLGKPSDDSLNTFTARLLLLLESRCLLGESVYNDAVGEVLAAYWRDYPDHAEEFAPAFLANDILRLWRTLCVSYEAGSKSEPGQEEASRRLKNYRLKHSRLLTCFSGILFLLAIYSQEGTVSTADARKMVSKPPLERIQFVSGMKPEWGVPLKRVLDRYDQFLTATKKPKQELIADFSRDDPRRPGGDRKARQKYMDGAEELGQFVGEALTAIGNHNRFHRLLIV